MKTGKKKEKEKEKEKEKKDKWDGEEGLLVDTEFAQLSRMSDISLDQNAGYFKKFTPTIAYPNFTKLNYYFSIILVSFLTGDRYLTQDGKKKVLKLLAGTTVIGRSESCTLTIEDKQVFAPSSSSSSSPSRSSS